MLGRVYYLLAMVFVFGIKNTQKLSPAEKTLDTSSCLPIFTLKIFLFICFVVYEDFFHSGCNFLKRFTERGTDVDT